MIFPLLSEPLAELPGNGTLPLCREVDWDFTADRPVWQGGAPVYVSGHRAVLVWCWNALHAERGLKEIFSPNYGTEFTALVGRPYTAAVREAEAVRTVREALLVNPYVKAVDQVSVRFDGSILHLQICITTIYQKEASTLERKFTL